MRGGEDRSWSDQEGMTMENEILITVIFVGAGVLTYVVIPGLLAVEGRKPETREERSSSMVVGPGTGSHGRFERHQALRRRRT